MRWICLAFTVISFVSFISDLGMAKFPVIRVIPSVGNSSPTVLTSLLFFSTLVLLGIMSRKERRENKEKAQKHIKKLENDRK